MTAYFEPTQGCYQKNKEAVIVRETKTQYIVKIKGERLERRIRKSDMLHVHPFYRQFPNYRLVIT
jgi:hypothetical protein